MSNINKKDLHDLIERMPDNFTLEDLQYRLFVLQKLEKAEHQLKQGCKTYNLDEMRELVKNWRGEKEQKMEENII
ncbi:hypothetical protein LCGC14_0794890 [marine sediment metagenome]|uniref:Uncharacterized protein n=1 Tax=marine sediment metagenome TaxID=412755 RepID=A0A0F9QB99_9ZZZZ